MLRPRTKRRPGKKRNQLCATSVAKGVACIAKQEVPDMVAYLRLCKAALVDAGVDAVSHVVVQLCDFSLQLLGEQIRAG